MLTFADWATVLHAKPYLICRKCGKEIMEISRVSPWDYQYHPRCNPNDTRNIEREEKKQAFFEAQREARLCNTPGIDQNFDDLPGYDS